MGMTGVTHMIAPTSRTAVAAEEINRIIDTINSSGNRKPEAVLYLGRVQHRAIKMIDVRDVVMNPLRDNEFAGWPIIWVMMDSYIHLAA